MAATGKKRVRFTIDVNLPSMEAKTAFIARLESVRGLLTPPGTRKLDTYGLLQALFTCAEAAGRTPGASVCTSAPMNETENVQPGPSGAPRNLLEGSGEQYCTTHAVTHHVLALHIYQWQRTWGAAHFISRGG